MKLRRPAIQQAGIDVPLPAGADGREGVIMLADARALAECLTRAEQGQLPHASNPGQGRKPTAANPSPKLTGS